MFNPLRNYKRNKIISSNSNYFMDRAENHRDKKVRKWSIATCVAIDQFLVKLIFDLKEQNNPFFLNKEKLGQVSGTKLFKTLAVFYLYLFSSKIRCYDEFIKGVCEVFEISELEFENLEYYKIYDEQRNEFDLSFLPEETREYFETSRISPTSMIYFLELLLKEGLEEDINKDQVQYMKFSVTVSELAIFYYTNLVRK